ncbi:MAG: hypothetical protein IPG63_00320 [Xanthomonadales bacterium]|nr:hypothetical protein [Xanthomonadales bacterium]
MSASTLRPAALALALAATLGAHAAEYRYDGRLDDSGQPANGRYDIELSVFGGETAGKALSPSLTFPGVEVRDGRFRLDFDVPLAVSRETWVQVAVRSSGDASFSTIPGRSKAISAPLIGACWSSTGDAGSNPSTNFLGTTDAKPLVIKTANVQSLRIEPSAGLYDGFPETANVTAGSHLNAITVGADGATISGGGLAYLPNRVTDDFGTVGGGYSNRAGDADFANDTQSASKATVGGGEGNQAASTYATIAGGINNIVNGTAGSVGGGNHNLAVGIASTVAGGTHNTAHGAHAVVGGGNLNCAGGASSWAGGYRSKVRPASSPSGLACSGIPTTGSEAGRRTFLWADSQSADFISSGPNQFLVRADGGFMLNASAVQESYDDVVLRSRETTADADFDMRLATRNGKDVLVYVADGTGSLVFRPNDIGATFDRLQVEGGMGGTAALSNGGTWTNASSRSFKQGFQPVDAEDVLTRVLDLDISRWQYIGSAEGQHMGPVAEDFHAAFGLGRSEKQIATVDADGVALAAIQGLNAKLEAENAALRGELEALRRLVESRLNAEH